MAVEPMSRIIEVDDWDVLRCSAGGCVRRVVALFTPKMHVLTTMLCACKIHEDAVEAGAKSQWGAGLIATRRPRRS